ncbi:MAG: carbohydrate kinase [Promethearchaeota archaeon]|nr:MAG: carbohydrate kinase [Candidatus Lokiarchaeota archaeon]
MSKLFLGLDCSTQSLTGMVINYEANEIVCEEVIDYDNDLPKYGTKNGIIINENPTIVHCNPLMWIDALELLFERLKNKYGFLKKIKAISGSGQQHGTVYLNADYDYTLRNLDTNISISDQLKNCLTRESSPIWMDSSTSPQCEQIRKTLGGRDKTIKITGSNTFERFSGPQIRKFYQQNPRLYNKTSKIHLVSSFMASILSGKNAPIDHGDGAGMNLMNINSKDWDERAIRATAPDLESKLPPLVRSNTIIGTISPHFVEKYSFSPETIIIAWSGDNPNSLIGVGLRKTGDFAISLGTSDTYFGVLQEPYLDFQEQAHIFGSPMGNYMCLICYKNGSLAREKIRETFDLTWKEFSSILRQTPAGNYGKIMLPYFFPEIVPLVLKPNVYRFGFDKEDRLGNVRGIIEAQFLSMRIHSKWIKEPPKTIHATGGAAANRDILQIAADIFQTPIIKYKYPNSAALGAALRAAKSYYDENVRFIPWKNFGIELIETQKMEIIRPNPKNKELYDNMATLYKKYENYVLKKENNPESFRKLFINTYF